MRVPFCILHLLASAAPTLPLRILTGARIGAAGRRGPTPDILPALCLISTAPLPMLAPLLISRVQRGRERAVCPFRCGAPCVGPVGHVSCSLLACLHLLPLYTPCLERRSCRLLLTRPIVATIGWHYPPAAAMLPTLRAHELSHRHWEPLDATELRSFLFNVLAFIRLVPPPDPLACFFWLQRLFCLAVFPSYGWM